MLTKLWHTVRDTLIEAEIKFFNFIKLEDNPIEGGRLISLWCPGCAKMHSVTIESEDSWTWNYDAYAITLYPSIKIPADEYSPKCHAFVRNGRWEYLPDCTHHFCNKSIPLIAIPEKYR